MSRRPASDVVETHTIDGAVFKIATSTLTHLPSAPAFIRHLRRKGVSAHVAGEYARLAAKALRDGYAASPERITARSERTAVNAYWLWVEGAYHERVHPVIAAFADVDMRRAVSWLRIGSVVPPTPGKKIPRLLKVATMEMNSETLEARMIPPEYGWVDTDQWTLHVPTGPCAAHTDPCLTCMPVELTPLRLEIIARAFEGAYGHRQLGTMDPASYLFGTPPRDGVQAQQNLRAMGEIVALLPPSVLADHVRGLQGYVTGLEDAFRSRLAEGHADVVVISRELTGRKYGSILHAIRQAWEADEEAVRVEGVDALASVPDTTS
jgi:hypothetical protein